MNIPIFLPIEVENMLVIFLIISCFLLCIYLYCTNTLHVPLIIEHLDIASEEGFVGWLVLPFREKNKFV